MLKYFINRLGISIVTLAIVITSVFFLVRLAPGGPFDGERRLPVEIEKSKSCLPPGQTAQRAIFPIL